MAVVNCRQSWRERRHGVRANSQQSGKRVAIEVVGDAWREAGQLVTCWPVARTGGGAKRRQGAAPLFFGGQRKEKNFGWT